MKTLKKSTVPAARANRHERRLATKIMRMETRMIPVDEFLKMPSRCAWEGCSAATTEPHNHGWSSMLLYKGEARLNFIEIDPRLMARDCVLCAEHARYLDENLLINIGGQLRHAEGAA